jgi:hypothetical protein
VAEGIGNPHFVFPAQQHRRRGSSLGRMTALQQAQMGQMRGQAQHRRVVGSDGSGRVPVDVKGKGPRGRSGSRDNEGRMNLYPTGLEGNLYWTDLAARYAGGQI